MNRLPAGLLLFDTGIYIRFSRGEDYSWLGEDAQILERTILSAVVAAELYAGTRDYREKRALDELCRAHRSRASSRHHPQPHGLRPEFCYAAPEAPSDKWTLSATFATY